jgi:hypothetical protein
MNETYQKSGKYAAKRLVPQIEIDRYPDVIVWSKKDSIRDVMERAVEILMTYSSANIAIRVQTGSEIIFGEKQLCIEVEAEIIYPLKNKP